MNDAVPKQIDHAATIAAFLGLSTGHIRRLTREHRIPAIPVGDRGVRFDRAEVLKAFAARGKSPTSADAGKR
jgi:excisionase family DNA binding protein